MMKQFNRKQNVHRAPVTVSVRDHVSGRQANNLLEQDLGASVGPWFADWTSNGDNPRVAQAVRELDQPARRDRAAAFLGLEIITSA